MVGWAGAPAPESVDPDVHRLTERAVVQTILRISSHPLALLRRVDDQVGDSSTSAIPVDDRNPLRRTTTGRVRAAKTQVSAAARPFPRLSQYADPSSPVWTLDGRPSIRATAWCQLNRSRSRVELPRASRVTPPTAASSAASKSLGCRGPGQVRAMATVTSSSRLRVDTGSLPPAAPAHMARQTPQRWPALSGALQLPLLQTVMDVSAKKIRILVRPFRVEMLRFFDHTAAAPTTSRPAEGVPHHCGDQPHPPGSTRTAAPATTPPLGTGPRAAHMVIATRRDVDDARANPRRHGGVTEPPAGGDRSADLRPTSYRNDWSARRAVSCPRARALGTTCRRS